MRWNKPIAEGRTTGNTNPAPLTPKPLQAPPAQCRNRSILERELKMITYKSQSDGSIRVFLEGRLVGTLRRFTQGWQYRPRGSTPGEFFSTLDACKQSLESGDRQ
jgi:hypothetical protein